MKTNYPIFLILFFSALTIRTCYEILKKAGKVNPRNKILFAFIFLAMCLLWVSWFSLCPLDPYSVALPKWAVVAGLLVLIAGFCLAFGALAQLKALENVDHLVTSGLYAFVRHPMYTGFVFWIIGWATYHGALISLFAGIVGILNIHYWRRNEEIYLDSTYKEEYQIYRQRTWF